MTSTQLRGVPVSPGQATGPLLHAGPAQPAAPEQPRRYPQPEDVGVEAARIRPAADLVAAGLRDEAALADGTGGVDLDLAAMLAADASLLDSAEELVRDETLPAVRAVWDATERFADGLAAVGGVLASRTGELREVRDRLIGELTEAGPASVPRTESPSVLVARELSAEQVAALEPTQLLAIVTELGGPASPIAIIARDNGIPAIVGCGGVTALDASHLHVDGGTGVVEVVDPQVSAADHAPGPAWSGRGSTRDGFRVPLLAEVGSAQDAVAAADARAEGIGLLRTEWCYLATDLDPTVEEQADLYRSVLTTFHGKHLVIRTLDASSDQPLTVDIPPAEPNPALGLRGLRAARRHPDLLDRQLGAIAVVDGKAVAPLATTPAEVEWFVGRARAAGVREAGALIDTPAAALLAEEFLRHAEFATIATDELAQYTMAADRELGTVATLADPWQPAVLRLVTTAIGAGERSGKPVGVAGSAAADPLLACVLVGLGATDLAVPPAALRAVGARLAGHDRAQCRAAGLAAAAAGDPVEARAAAESALLG